MDQPSPGKGSVSAWRASLLTSTLTIVALSGACSAPTPTAPPVPVVPNTPPTIVSVGAGASRVDAGDTLTLSAVVQDNDTPLDQLTYEWSAAPLPGTFTGSGRSVTWLAPHQATTPDTYTFTLKVTEHFTSAGQPMQNVVSASTQVHYNDSAAEMEGLAYDFLVNKFGNFNVSPQECVVNFSDNCTGKDAELSDIEANREFFHILSATFSVDSTSFNGNKTTSTVVGPCVFEDIVQSTGVRERVFGNCIIKGVYENFKWFLCDSGFQSTAATVPLDRLRHRAPGVR
jgi:hypothetical protein